MLICIFRASFLKRMVSKFDSYQKRRLRSSYFSVVTSISLVMFMVGFLGLVVLKSSQLANYFKERVLMTLFLKDGLTKTQIENLRTSLIREKFTKNVVFISKKEAAAVYSRELGEDFVQYLGTNPLKNSIDIYLKPVYVTPEKMLQLSNRFDKNSFVLEVSYDRPLVAFLTQNIQKISLWLSAISSFFVGIALILINSFIKLSIYSERFTIKTMQMVGATKSFIRRPFVWRGLKLGFLGAMISLIGLMLVVYYADQKIPILALSEDYVTLTYLGGSILVMALIISWGSTFLATKRFLNLQTDELYN